MHDRLLLALVLGVGGAARAQDGGGALQLASRGPAFFTVASPGEVRVDARDAAVFRRFVTLDLADVSVPVALRALEIAAPVHITYPADLIPADARVTIEAKRLSLGGALTSVLQDVPVDVELSGNGVLALVRRGGAVVVPVARRHQAPGTVQGRVTDSASGHGIQNATVALEATNWRTSTDTGGHFSLRGIRPGTYRLMVRILGYRPLTKEITLGADSSVRADLALAKTANQLDEVVTTGTMVPTEVKALPTPITIITVEQLERQNTRRLDQIFRGTVPGSVAWDQGAYDYYQAITVRGINAFGLNTVKTYLDGIQIASDAFGLIDPASLERIEVIRGPEASTIYGSGATGGVIQAFTRKGTIGQTQPEFSGKTSFGRVESPYMSSAPRQDHSLVLTGGGEQFGYAFGGGYSSTGQWVPEYRSSYPSFYGGVRFSQGRLDVDLSARAYYHNWNFVYSPAEVAGGYSRPPENKAEEDQNQTTGLHLHYAATSAWQHNLTVGTDRFTNASHTTKPRNRFPGDTLFSVSHSNIGSKFVSYNTSLAVPISTRLSSVLTAGLDYHDLTHDAASFYNLPTTRGSLSPGSANTPLLTNEPTYDAGYYTQAQIAIADMVFLTAGLRAEQSPDFGRNVGTAYAPRVGMSVVRDMGGMSAKVRASYGEAIRAPEPEQKTQTVGADFQRANPDLRPERQRGGDVGFDLYIGRDASIGITYYNQSAIDLIDFPLLGDTVYNGDTLLLYQNQNVGRIRNSGWEFEGMLNLLDRLALSGQYSITSSVIMKLAPGFEGDYQVGDRALGVPRYSGGGAATYTPLKGTSVSLGVTYIGAQTNYDLLAEDAYFYGKEPYRGPPGLRLYWARYPGFFKENLNLSQAFSRTISAFLSVENLTNTNPVEQYNTFPIPGRQTMLGVRVRH